MGTEKRRSGKRGGTRGGTRAQERAKRARPPELAVIAEAALQRNARDPVLLDLRGLSDAADWFLIASGDSDTHARAIADNILEEAQRHGFRPAGVEGKGPGHWILLDYVDVVVHVFLPRVREFYQLEELWGDAPRTLLEDAPSERT